MRETEFFEIIGSIDEEKIMEADSFTKRKNPYSLARYITTAACFVVIAAGVLTVFNNKEKNEGMPPSPITKEDEAEYVVSEYAEEILKADSAEKSRTESAEEDEQAKGTSPDFDNAYMQAVDAESLNDKTAEFFGGAYLNNDGRYVIILTEDTPENRKTVCEELGREETDTLFETGKFTLSYLTQLQEKISDLMAQGELSSVVSSSLLETSNVIEVGITYFDADDQEKINALDSMGGAIVFKQAQTISCN